MFTFYFTMNYTPISIKNDGLLLSTGLTQKHPLPHRTMSMEGGSGVNPTVWDSGINCVVGLDGNRGKFGWSEGDVLEIVGKKWILK